MPIGIETATRHAGGHHGRSHNEGRMPIGIETTAITSPTGRVSVTIEGRMPIGIETFLPARTRTGTG